MKNRIFTLAVASAISIATMAQFEGTTPDERIAATAGEDSISVGRGHISMFQMGLQNQDYKDAYVSWKWLMTYAPFANTGIYKQSPIMFYNLNLKESDPAQKEKYFNEMMKMFDLRLSRLDSLNSMERRERLKSSIGDVMAVKAEYYNYIAPTIPSLQWNAEKNVLCTTCIHRADLCSQRCSRQVTDYQDLYRQVRQLQNRHQQA